MVRIGFFAGGDGGRRHVPEHLVHVREHAEVGRAGLAAHPGHELREDERDDELPLLVGQVREVDDRRAGLAVGREQERSARSSGAPAPHAANDGEATSALSRKASSVRSLGGKNWSTSNTPSLRIGGWATSPISVPRSRSRPAAPGVLDQVREQHVLAAGERVGLDARRGRAGSSPCLRSRRGASRPRSPTRAAARRASRRR